MNKREKILVFASVAAVIWGVIVSLDSGEKDPVVINKSEDIQLFVAKVTEKVKSESKDTMTTNILSEAFSDDGPNPFLGKTLLPKRDASDLVYSGYIRCGNDVYALINKKEYNPGDTIEGTGMQIKTISPYRVVLVEDKKKKRILPLTGGGK